MATQQGCCNALRANRRGDRTRSESIDGLYLRSAERLTGALTAPHIQPYKFAKSEVCFSCGLNYFRLNDGFKKDKHEDRFNCH